MATSYKSRFSVARKDIEAAFDALPSPVLTTDSVAEILNLHRDHWRIGKIGTLQFIELLRENSNLKPEKLKFESRPVTRLIWRKATDYEIVQSINENGYFSHYTAIYLNGLTDQVPKVFYFNVEQAVRPGGGKLVQESINRVFRGKCRLSARVAPLGERSVCMLNGGNTDCLGVRQQVSPEGKASIRVTDVERTLIDAVVRPIYSGGVHQVLAAFKAASNKVSVNRLASYLMKINYTYPFHQAIGFYMERAGYREGQIELIRAFSRDFDFYLDYGIKSPEYIERWRLFVPQGL